MSADRRSPAPRQGPGGDVCVDRRQGAGGDRLRILVYDDGSSAYLKKQARMLHCRRWGNCAIALNRCRDSRCAGCPIEG